MLVVGARAGAVNGDCDEGVDGEGFNVGDVVCGGDGGGGGVEQVGDGDGVVVGG